MSPGAFEILTPSKFTGEPGTKIGFGFANLRPFFIGGYRFEESAIGIGLGGILFSGLRIKYNVGVADVSYIKRWIGGERSLVGVGFGFGGAIAGDENFSEEGKRHSILEGHGYATMYILHSPKGVNVGFFFSSRLGLYYMKASYLKVIARNIAEEAKKEGLNINVPETDKSGGFLFIPSFGINSRIIEEKVLFSVAINIPITGAMLYEPELHPFVPSFNIILLF